MSIVDLFLPSRPRSNGSVLLVIRVMVGYGFIQHGMAKIINGPDKFAANLDALGIHLPGAMSWLTIATELAGGIAILTGLMVPVICIPLAAIMLVALFFVHLPFGFSSIKLQAVTPQGIKFGPPGYEVILLYLSCLWSLAVLGAGPLSLDSWLSKKLRSREI